MSASDTPDLGIDQEALNDSERQLLDIFENRRSASLSEGGDTTPVSAEELTEPTGTPGSTVGSTAASEAPTTVEGQSGASESEPSSTPSDVIPPSPAAGDAPDEGGETGGESDLTTPAFTFAGVDYTPDTLARAVQTHQWFNQLNDQQVAAIDALMSGQYRLVPANEAVPTPPPASAPTVATPPVSPPPDSPVVDDAGEWLDPRAQAEVARLQAELAQMRQQFAGTVTPLVQSQADAQFQARRQAIDSAAESFKSQYSLDDDLVETIGRSVVQAGVLPSLITQHNGDVEAATRQAFEMMFWTTPSFRDSYMQSKNAADLADLAAQDQAQADKQRKMTALTASGGSTPRRDPTPSTKDDRHSAMVELIRADMNGS